MRIRWVLLALILPLSACDHYDDDRRSVASGVKSDGAQMLQNIEHNVVTAATMARNNLKESGEDLHKWLVEPPPAERQPQAIASSYCYRTYQDVLCYRAPMPGWENRLVGYQGTYAKAPPLAVMEPLPVSVDTKPSARPAVTPVFASLPKQEEKDKKKSNAVPAVPDPAHQTLPNALVPQL